MLERPVFFSDAVFAVTPLVIEFGSPHVPAAGSPDAAAGSALLSRLPKIIGYVVSVLVIAAFRAAHHHVLGMVDRHDPGFVWPDPHPLLAIAVLPFATGS